MEAQVRRGNLTANPTSFVGRAKELQKVTALLESHSLVTLSGVAGVGKSRLALKVAGHLAHRFTDGVWIAELSAEQNPDLVVHDVAAALGIAERSVRPQVEILAEYLATKNLLLVLDTCEHMLSACGTLVSRVLSRAPKVRVLATSRQPLGLPQEVVYTVDPLPVPEPGTPVTDDGAVRLFLDRARALVPGFAPDLAAVGRLCRRLDGIPLAIELAARRVRSMSVEEIADGLDDRFALLIGDSRTPVERRHQTLRTAVGWSHQLLAPEERLLWARLTVFAGTFDAATAQAVCADERLPDISGPLGRLVYKSIVIAEGPRHRMLTMMREYGGEWLTRLGERERMVRRHREHYLFMARRADEEWYGRAQIAWADWAHAEMPNLRTALDGGLRDPAGLELAGALWFVWFCLGHVREGRYYLDRMLSAHPRPSPARTKALWAAGLVALAQGDLKAVRARARRALAEARGLGDAVAVGYATYALAILHLIDGDLHRADTLITQAILCFRRMPRPHIGLPIAEVTRALTLILRGEYQRALDVIEPQRARCARHGEMWAKSYGDLVRSYAHLARGEVAEARAGALDALTAKRRLGDVMGSALAIDQLAATAAARHLPERAAFLLGVAQRMWLRIGRPQLGTIELIAARERTEASVRGILGDAAFDAAFTLGQTVDPAEAVTRIQEM